ncbi:hypothetical protein BH10CYA1_BH10CYA1_29150 [soil metagenome]
MTPLNLVHELWVANHRCTATPHAVLRWVRIELIEFRTKQLLKSFPEIENHSHTGAPPFESWHFLVPLFDLGARMVTG